MLFQLGSVQFDVAPVNVHEASREVGHDFAAKDVIGAPKPRESMGEADEKVSMSGRLFPHRLGGLGGLAALEAMARAGTPQILVRGDGMVYGWFLIESVKEKSTYLDGRGVGREIEFDISLVRSPNAASAGSIMSMLFSLFG